jgi:Skp family chaperone for outer membrane proteins
MRALLHVAALFAAIVLGPGGPLSATQQTRGLQTTSTPQLVPKGRDYALLFATDAYADRAWRPLRNPLRDATTIAAELQQSYGFTEARVVTNPTLKQIFDTLDEYLSKRRFADNDQLLIFFAGHGLYRPELDLGFIVASDSRDPRVDRANQSYFSFETLYRYVDRIRAKHIFLVLDVCHGGTFADAMAMRGDPARSDYEVAALPERISRILARTTRKYLTSGGNEYVPDGAGAHSPFAAKFLEALRRRNNDGMITATDVYQVVRNVRPNEPVFGDFGRYEPVSDFVFVATRATPATGSMPAPVSPVDSTPAPAGSRPAGTARVGYVDLLALRGKPTEGSPPLKLADDVELTAALRAAGSSVVFTADSILVWVDTGLDLTPVVRPKLRGQSAPSTPTATIRLAEFRAGMIDARYLADNTEVGRRLSARVAATPERDRDAAGESARKEFEALVMPLVIQRAVRVNLDVVLEPRTLESGSMWMDAEFDLTKGIFEELDAASGTSTFVPPQRYPASSPDLGVVDFQRVVRDSVLGKQGTSRVQALRASIQKEVDARSGQARAQRVADGEKELETLNSRLLLEFQAEVLPVVESVAKRLKRRIVMSVQDGVVWVNPNADMTAAVVAGLDAVTVKRK